MIRGSPIRPRQRDTRFVAFPYGYRRPKSLATVGVILRACIQTRRHSDITGRTIAAGKTDEVGISPAPLDMAAIAGRLGQPAHLAEFTALNMDLENGGPSFRIAKPCDPEGQVFAIATGIE